MADNKTDDKPGNRRGNGSVSILAERRTTRARTGAQILVDQLLIHGVDTAYCVPGESYLAVLDAFYDTREQIRLIVCRQEGGAAYMAEAYGKLTGRPGICFVTRGPGATNASVGVHTAYQDSTPMIFFIGQVARPFLGRGAFQELDFGRMYGQMAKWVVQIDDPARIPELTARAFTLATSGRPGPVVIVLPEDMLREAAAAVDAAPYKTVQASPGASEMARLRELLAAARRPLMLLGGSTWTAQAVGDIVAFAEANRLATASTFRRQDRIDNLHPCYAGDLAIGPSPKLAERVREADLILAVGSRLGEIVSSGYTLFDVPRPRQTLVHISTGVEELGRVYQAELPINAGMPQFAAAARALRPVDSSPGPRRPKPRTASTSNTVCRCPTPGRCIWPRSSRTCATSCRATRSSPTAGATSPAGCIASGVIANSARSWGQPAARWAMAFQPAWRRRSRIRNAPFCHSRATDVS